jgi:hypothetical protein
MIHKEYNGWWNYETWCVGLWIDNDQGLYNMRRELVAQYDDLVNYELAERIKTWVDGMVPDLGATLWSDLLGAALSEVNWLELADSWREEEEAA